MWNLVAYASEFALTAQSNTNSQQDLTVIISLIANFAQIVGIVITFHLANKDRGDSIDPVIAIAFITFLLVIVITFIPSILAYFPNTQFSVSTGIIPVIVLLLVVIGLENIRLKRFKRYASASVGYDRHLQAVMYNILYTNNTRRYIRRNVRVVFAGIEKTIFHRAGNNTKFDITLLKPLDNGKLEVIELADNDHMIGEIEKKMEESFQWKPKINGVAGHVAYYNKPVLIPDLSDKDERDNYHWVPIRLADNNPTGSLLVMPIESVNLKENSGDVRCAAVLSITCSQKKFLNDEHQENIKKLFANKLGTLTVVYTLV